ncbi:MAG TPA: cytochrome c [Blastocatellia bacterium]|nr:cytochrome c [Blastocatellia bacterium]
MGTTRNQIKTSLAVAALISSAALALPGSGAYARASYAADAAATFKAKCASCHAADGSGSTAAGKSLKVLDLRSAEVQKQSDAQLYEIIAKGKDKMPGYEKPLGADTCKALVAHIRKLGGK